MEAFIMLINKTNFQLIATILGVVGTIIKLLNGTRFSLIRNKLNNIELYNKLEYDTDESNKNLVRSEVFYLLTKRSPGIHKINLIFNSYDPRRLLLIYKKAPGFVMFDKNNTDIPLRLSNRYSRLLIIFLVIIMPIIPAIYFKYFSLSYIEKYIMLIIFCIISIYSINQIDFLFVVNGYYKDLNYFNNKTEPTENDQD